MSYQEIVNRLVPFAPVLTEVACVPPIRVEATIAKPRQFSKQIQVAVKDAVEHSQPEVSCWYCHLQSIGQYLLPVTSSDWTSSIFTDRNDVLKCQIYCENVSKKKF